MFAKALDGLMFASATSLAILTLCCALLTRGAAAALKAFPTATATKIKWKNVFFSSNFI